jgi:hypothetical protein
VKSNVGVLSEVMLSVLFEPESELVFKSGADKTASPAMAVGLDGVAGVVPAELDAVTTALKNFPTPLAGIVYVAEVAPEIVSQTGVPLSDEVDSHVNVLVGVGAPA